MVITVAYNQQYTGVHEEIKQKIDSVLDCDEISAKARVCKRKSGGKKHVNLNSCYSDAESPACKIDRTSCYKLCPDGKCEILIRSSIPSSVVGMLCVCKKVVVILCLYIHV